MVQNESTYKQIAVIDAIVDQATLTQASGAQASPACRRSLRSNLPRIEFVAVMSLNQFSALYYCGH